MTDPDFFPLAHAVAIADLAEAAQARVGREPTAEWRARGLASLASAGAGDVAFFASPRRRAELRATHAGACLVAPRDAADAPPGAALLLTEEPARAFARLAAILYPKALKPPRIGGGVAPGVQISPQARLEPGVHLAAGAVIGAGVEIGSGTTIGPHVVIGDHVRIGRDCAIGAHVSIFHAFVGDRVVVHPGARVGQDGFGFVAGSDRHLKVAQLGRVIIQDDVEIGANTTIDRGALDDTIVGEGSKIDNLVQIAHNVVVGRHCLIAAQAGIAGSTAIGDFVAIGGQAGVGGHIVVGVGARIAGQAGVLRDVEPGARVGGSPAGPVREWLRTARRRPRRERGAA